MNYPKKKLRKQSHFNRTLKTNEIENKFNQDGQRPIHCKLYNIEEDRYKCKKSRIHRLLELMLPSTGFEVIWHPDPGVHLSLESCQKICTQLAWNPNVSWSESRSCPHTLTTTFLAWSNFSRALEPLLKLTCTTRCKRVSARPRVV